MPSTSAAQHRWIGWLHSNPEARARSGMSKAKVDEWLRSDRGSPWKKRQTGGSTDTSGGLVDPTSSTLGGLTPSASTMNPIMQSMVQRYSSLSTEKLRELATMLGNTNQGKVVQAILRQKQMMPQAQPTAQTTGQTQQQGSSFQPQQLGQAFQTTLSGMQPGQGQQQQQGQARGGRAFGGIGMSMAEPWWTRREASSADSGLLHGSSLGRADAVKTSAPSGSYVLPADVVSGLGEGNTLAGARVVSAMMSTGPYGTALPRIQHGRGPPSPPHPAAASSALSELAGIGGTSTTTTRGMIAKGGGVQQRDAEERTPVALSHGEIALAPRDVLALASAAAGKPVTDLRFAHRVLDHWVVVERKKHIKKLASLKAPVGSDKSVRIQAGKRK